MPNRINTSVGEMQERINEIINIRSCLPKVEAGNPLQLYKYRLSLEMRTLKLRITKIQHGGLTDDEKRLFILSFGSKCMFCGDTKNPSVDHIIPISKGGKDTRDNLQVLCVSCNSRKGDRVVK